MGLCADDFAERSELLPNNFEETAVDNSNFLSTNASDLEDS